MTRRKPQVTEFDGHVLVNVESSSLYRRRRRLWVRENGEIPEGSYLSLRCEFKNCVAPEHARLMPLGGVRATVLEMFESGMSREEIAEAVGRSIHHVRRLLHNVAPPEAKQHPYQWTPATLERAEALLREGVPTTWVAEDAGVSRSMVDSLRQRIGLPADPTWMKVQVACRKNHLLAPLHELFNPPTTSKVLRA